MVPNRHHLKACRKRVKIIEWREFIDCFGLSIKADPSRVGKKNVYIFHIGYIPRPSYVKLHIERHQLEKWFNLKPQNLCLYQLTKHIDAEIVPHLYNALRYPQLGKICCCFLIFSFKSVL